MTTLHHIPLPPATGAILTSGCQGCTVLEILPAIYYCAAGFESAACFVALYSAVTLSCDIIGNATENVTWRLASRFTATEISYTILQYTEKYVNRTFIFCRNYGGQGT
jgi:hypothetical protein